MRWFTPCVQKIFLAGCLSIASAIMGFQTADATAIDINVPGTSDPWLAGMPDGSTASMGDIAPDQSPVEVMGLPALIPGTSLSFGVSGEVSNGPCCALIGPDGGAIEVHRTGAENGISSILAPINSLLGIFLGAEQPDLSDPPTALDFSSPESREFPALSPLLKQVFFIGDGVNSDEIIQEFIIPVDATRLYLGTMDGREWSNNLGSFDVSVFITSVPEPTTLALTAFGLIALAVPGSRNASHR